LNAITKQHSKGLNALIRIQQFSQSLPAPESCDPKNKENSVQEYRDEKQFSFSHSFPNEKGTPACEQNAPSSI